MSTRKKIIWSFICLSIAVFAGQTLSQARELDGTREATNSGSQEQQRLRERQRLDEQSRQRLKILLDKFEQMKKQTRSESAKSAAESMRQALRATEQQWKVIKPRLDKVKYLASQARLSIVPHSYGRSRSYGGGRNSAGAGAGITAGSGANVKGRTETSMPNNRQPGTRIEEDWEWFRAWENKAPIELTEGEITCEELLELLEDKNSKAQEIEQKIEALQKIRQEAKKQLAKAQQELREVLTFRQEATFVLMLFLY